MKIMVAGNLLPVTFGNMIGGAVLVGAVYWFAYLRKANKVPPPGPPSSRRREGGVEGGFTSDQAAPR